MQIQLPIQKVLPFIEKKQEELTRYIENCKKETEDLKAQIEKERHPRKNRPWYQKLFSSGRKQWLINFRNSSQLSVNKKFFESLEKERANIRMFHQALKHSCSSTVTLTNEDISYYKIDLKGETI